MTKTYAGSFKSGTGITLTVGLILLACAPFITPVRAHGAEVITSWWPRDGAHMTGTQPFKAVVEGADVGSYEMFWQVDNGQLNSMSSNYSDYPHKEAAVDLVNWTWHGSGPYVVNFVARKGGSTIAERAVTIYVDNGMPMSSPSSATVLAPVVISDVVEAPIVISDVSAVAKTTATSGGSQALSSMSFYVNPNSVAAQQAKAWSTSNPTGAKMMQTLAAQPTAVWLGEWNSNVKSDVQTLMQKAAQTRTTPIFVAYAIPQRDCGGYSSGGTNNPTAYRAWISQIAAGIGNGSAVVVLEPDSLAQITCLSGSDQAARLSLLSDAVKTLKANTLTKVYIDAGHSGWVDVTTMSKRLTAANIALADGFALNVSNFMSTASETSYGTAISSQLGNKHFIIDTSRNGNGSDGSWCNPPGRAIGTKPTASTGSTAVDAYLWLKVPGESDGTCNGGPSAGSWWPSYAVSLVSNAR